MQSWSWFEGPVGSPDYTFGASILRLSVAQRRATFDWLVEAEQPSLFGLPSDATAPAPQGAFGLGANYFASNGPWSMGIFPKQAYIRLHRRNNRNTALTIGRFEFNEGMEMLPKDATVASLDRERISQRLIGTFSFSEVGRSFDGAEFSHSTGAWNLTAVAARATRGVFQTDGWADLEVDIQYGALTHDFQNSTAQWRMFAVGYHDGREALKSDNRPTGLRTADHQNIRIGTAGADLVKALHMQRGTADLLVWAAYQFGNWGSLQQRAVAGALEAGYQWNTPAKPWLRTGYFRGSGDNNPSDGIHGSFFQMLPTPRIYARFPFFNLMNNEDAFLELSLTPLNHLRLRSDAHVLRLSNAHDLWYQGGGAYDTKSFGFSGRPSGGSTALANLYDLSADYQITNHVGVTGYLAYAQGKAVIHKIYQDPNARFAYLEMLYQF
jgi:hypothetical protein